MTDQPDLLDLLAELDAVVVQLDQHRHTTAEPFDPDAPTTTGNAVVIPFVRRAS